MAKKRDGKIEMILETKVMPYLYEVRKYAPIERAYIFGSWTKKSKGETVILTFVLFHPHLPLGIRRLNHSPDPCVRSGRQLNPTVCTHLILSHQKTQSRTRW